MLQNKNKSYRDDETINKPSEKYVECSKVKRKLK